MKDFIGSMLTYCFHKVLIQMFMYFKEPLLFPQNMGAIKLRIEFQFYSLVVLSFLEILIRIQKDTEDRYRKKTHDSSWTTSTPKINKSTCTGHVVYCVVQRIQDFLSFPSPCPSLTLPMVPADHSAHSCPWGNNAVMLWSISWLTWIFFQGNCILFMECCTVCLRTEGGTETEESTQLKMPPFAKYSISSEFPCGKRQ